MLGSRSNPSREAYPGGGGRAAPSVLQLSGAGAQLCRLHSQQHSIPWSSGEVALLRAPCPPCQGQVLKLGTAVYQGASLPSTHTATSRTLTGPSPSLLRLVNLQTSRTAQREHGSRQGPGIGGEDKGGCGSQLPVA